MPVERKPLPLIILGLDGGDPYFIARWAREGHLPTIASIMERGCWGRTAGAELVSEHGVWVSLFSGISRGRHGYYYFRQLKPGTYDLQAVTGRDIDAPPFWARLRGGQRKVAIIDVPDASPLTGLAGIQLSNWAAHHAWDPRQPGYRPAAEPGELLRDVRRFFGPQIPIDEDHYSSFGRDRDIRRRALERAEKKGALCRHLFTRDRFDLIVTVFSESHVAGHQFWKYRPAAQRAGAPENELTHAIRDVYRAIDRQMGRLLAELPRDANVVIVSSVGMEDHYPTTGLIEAFCRQLGYQAPPDPTPLSLRPLPLLRRTLPEAWRIALSRHLRRDIRERLLADQFRSGTNWSRTTAFAPPAAYTSFLRVNLRGRESQGTVEPGSEYHTLLDRLEADLRQLTDPDTGEPAVKDIARTVEAFRCDAPVSLPDLFVEWKPGRFMERVTHPRAELVQRKPDFFRVSDHSRNGFVTAAGPSIRGRGDLADVSLLDLAPTFLSLMGDPGEGMAGRVIDRMIRG